MFRRILGLVILLVSLIMIGLLLGGAYYVGQITDSIGESLDNILTLTLDTLEHVSVTLEQTKSTVAEANNALGTASEAAANLSILMDDMQPLLASTTTVVAKSPESAKSSVSAVYLTYASIDGWPIAGEYDRFMVAAICVSSVSETET